MRTIILGFGVLVGVLGLLGLLRPSALLNLIGFLKRPAGFWVAVLLRLGIGVVLILGAAACKFTLALQILGGVAIAAGLGMLVYGAQRTSKLIDRWADKPPGFIRAWSLFPVALAGFLFYAAW